MQKCIDALDGPTNVINKLMLAQTDKSPGPETDTLPYAASAISSQEDYWEMDDWETMTQEHPEEREIDQNNDLIATEHDYTKELASFYKGLCKLLGEEQTTSYNVCSDSNYIEATVLLPYEVTIKEPEIAAFKQYTLSPDKVSSKAIIGKDGL